MKLSRTNNNYYFFLTLVINRWWLIVIINQQLAVEDWNALGNDPQTHRNVQRFLADIIPRWFVIESDAGFCDFVPCMILYASSVLTECSFMNWVIKHDQTQWWQSNTSRRIHSAKSWLQPTCTTTLWEKNIFRKLNLTEKLKHMQTAKSQDTTDQSSVNIRNIHMNAGCLTWALALITTGGDADW